MATIAMNIEWNLKASTCDACGGDLHPIFYSKAVVMGEHVNVCSGKCIAFLQDTWKPTLSLVRIVKRVARMIIF